MTAIINKNKVALSFFNELKRRNVVRVAIAYNVAAWLVIQVVETIFPAFGFGDANTWVIEADQSDAACLTGATESSSDYLFSGRYHMPFQLTVIAP